MRQVFVNRSLERRHAGKGATPEARVGDLREPAFHQIQPGAAGRHEVKVHARVAGQPPPHVRTLAGTQVIQGQMQRLVGRRGRAVPHIVMGLAFGNARAQRQHGAGAVQRLNPTLLIDAKHHGFGGRIHIQAHHVAQFFDKVGVRRQFEAPDPMGLEPVLTPNLPNRAVAFARRRLLQWVPAGGRVVKVGSRCFRRPGLEASRSTPGTPLVTNRRAHNRTVIRLTCSVRATAEGDSWCDSIHTSRARRAIFWGVVPWRATRANWACSVGDAKTQYR